MAKKLTLAVAGMLVLAASPLLASATAVPSISGISPVSGQVGTVVVLSGSGFLSTNTVNFGNGVIEGVQANSRKQLVFKIPANLAFSCDYSSPSCNVFEVVQPGTYQVSVTNKGGTSNRISLTVSSN